LKQLFIHKNAMLNKILTYIALSIGVLASIYATRAINTVQSELYGCQVLLEVEQTSNQQMYNKFLATELIKWSIDY